MESSDIGKLLKDARDARGLSIEDVERDIKIRAKFLRAFEENQTDVFPGEVYARGFLKNYAEYLGLKSSDILSVYRVEHPMDEDEHRFKTREHIEYNKPKKRAPKAGPGVIIILIILVIAAVVLYFGRGMFAKVNEEVPNTEVAQKEEIITSPIAGEKVQETKTTTKPVADKMKFIVAGERCYVDIIVDGESIYRGMFERGEEKEFSYSQSVSIRTNDAGSITAVLNGASLGVLGPKGELLTKEYRVE